jgi:hypothetical protein
MERAVTYLENNHQHMHYDKAPAAGWPIATGMIEGACRFVIEDRSGITGARWSPDGEDILKLRAVVATGDLDDCCRPRCLHMVRQQSLLMKRQRSVSLNPRPAAPGAGACP